jgi:hypothetical protein
MLVQGRWTLCDDGIVRPVIEGEVLAADGSWLPVELLVDVGADRTVFTAGVLATLALPPLPCPHQLGGVGGAARTVAVATHLQSPLAAIVPSDFKDPSPASPRPKRLICVCSAGTS